MLVYQRVKGYLLPLGACHLHPWPPMDSRILLGCGSTSIISSVWIPRTTLGYLAVGVVGGLLLLRLFCERLLIWLRTFLFQDGCCHWMRMHVFMESWKKRWKKNTSFLLGMQFEAEKKAIGKNTVGAPHLAKHHFCKGGLSWFALAFGQLPFALEQYIMVPKAWSIQLLQFQQIPSPKETWQRVSNMPIQVVSDFRQSPKLSISLPTCVGPCTLHTVTIPRSM